VNSDSSESSLLKLLMMLELFERIDIHLGQSLNLSIFSESSDPIML
jgi:hypothetical protein